MVGRWRACLRGMCLSERSWRVAAVYFLSDCWRGATFRLAWTAIRTFAACNVCRCRNERFSSFRQLWRMIDHAYWRRGFTETTDQQGRCNIVRTQARVVSFLRMCRMNFGECVEWTSAANVYNELQPHTCVSWIRDVYTKGKLSPIIGERSRFFLSFTGSTFVA